MSRGFWMAIGAMGGFFAGGWAGLGLAHLAFSCCYGETGLPTLGSLVGLGLGTLLGRYISPPRRDRSS